MTTSLEQKRVKTNWLFKVLKDCKKRKKQWPIWAK